MNLYLVHILFKNTIMLFEENSIEKVYELNIDSCVLIINKHHTK